MTAALATRSVLDAADWPAVALELITATAGAKLLAGEFHGNAVVSPAHERFARAVVANGEHRAVRLLGPQLGTWTYYTARAAWALCIDDRPAEHHIPALDGPLYVEPELRRLPLLDLAADVGAVRGRPIVVVSAARLPGGADGLCRRPGRVTVGTEVREVTLIELAESTVRVFAHELAHAIDPAARVGDVAERYADELGELLDEHRPATLAEAQAYVDQAEVFAVDPEPRPVTRWLAPEELAADESAPCWLPPPGAESLLLFAALPLLPRGATS